jgi:hypothetical protein
VYGLTREEADALIKEMIAAAQATSRLLTTIQIFGDFYQANEKVEKSLKKVSDLQWEYNRALESGSGNVKKLIKDQLTLLN